MSVRINQRLDFWESVHRRLCAQHYSGPVELGKVECEQIGSAYTLMLLVWSDAATCPLSSRTIDSIISILSNVSVDRFFSIMKDADDSLLDEISRSDYHLHCTDSFKQSLHNDEEDLFEPLVLWFDQVRSSVVDELSAFRIFHQIYSFIGRLTLRNRVDLEEEALERWLSVQSELEDFNHPSEGYRFLNYWFRKWFTSEDDRESFFSHNLPRHSDGQVSEHCNDTLEKYLAMGSDYLLDWWAAECNIPLPPYVQNRRFLRRSELRFVPKSTTKLRSICMEPASLQFFQQGMFSSFLNYFEHHSFLRHHIDLRRAELNRDLAEEGSYSGEFATIDLSDASDRITLAQVGVACEGTFIWDGLYATRCSHTLLPNGQTFELKSFASMGSACCFPVETLIFTACTCEAIRRCGGSPWHSKFRVYGDDIVVEREFAECLIDILTSLGYRVNETKSYYHDTPYTFRESCGGEYVHGWDVTPKRISRKFFTLNPSRMRRDASHYQAAIDLANEMIEFPTVRLFIIRQLLKMRRKELPLFSDDPTDSSAIYTTNPTNYRNIIRKGRGIWHGHPYDYQNYKVLHGCVKPIRFRQSENDVEEMYRYYDTLRSMSGRSDRFDLLDSQRLMIARKDTRPSKSLGSCWTHLYGIEDFSL